MYVKSIWLGDMKQEIAAFVPMISGFLSVLFFCVVIRLCKAFSERNVWHMRFVWRVLLLCVFGFLPASEENPLGIVNVETKQRQYDYYTEKLSFQGREKLKLHDFQESTVK